MAAIRAGQTLSKASTAAGVHVATVCRWKVADKNFAQAIRKADWERIQEHAARLPFTTQVKTQTRSLGTQAERSHTPTLPGVRGSCASGQNVGMSSRLHKFTVLALVHMVTFSSQMHMGKLATPSPRQLPYLKRTDALV